MAVQEVPRVARAYPLLVFMVSTAPAGEGELHTAVVRLTGLKTGGIWLCSLLWALKKYCFDLLHYQNIWKVHSV